MASVTAPRAAPAAVEPRKRNYARILEQTWIWSIVGYALLRFFIAWGAFSEHGANIWVFGLIDVGTAWPYAKSVAIVCKRSARSEWRELSLPLAVAVTTFFAPYAYLWFAAGEMPGGVRLAMAICVTVLLIAAAAGVLVKTRKLRSAARAAMVDRTRTAEALVALAGVGGDAATCLELRSDDLGSADLHAARSPSAMLIDLTGQVAELERPATKRLRE